MAFYDCTQSRIVKVACRLRLDKVSLRDGKVSGRQGEFRGRGTLETVGVGMLHQEQG